MNRRSSPIIVLVAATLCLAFVGCAEADPPSGSPADMDYLYGAQLPEGEPAEVPLDDIKDATIPYLESLANLLVTGDDAFDERAMQQAQALSPDAPGQEQVRSQLRAWRDQLAPEIVHDRASAFVFPAVQILGDDGRLYVGAQAEYELHAKEGVTEGAAERHVFIYEKQGDSWKLVEDRLCEPLSLLPDSDSGVFDDENTSTS